jgi:alanyl-tRNA synthetase
MATRRLYYDDAFLQEFTARVLRSDELPMEPGASSPCWGVVLDATAFYPTSGGQPFDTGKLGHGNVMEVREEGEEIVHVVDRDLEEGEIAGCVNWPRRFDHMQQHTAQHLLSAMLQERFGLQTVSFHLGEETSTIDVRGPQPNEEVLEGAERAANRIIFEDRNVTVRYGTNRQLAEMGIRKEVQREGILRAIEIEGADLQPCGGTHVKRTGQIGTLLVRKMGKIRQDWRLEFASGTRAQSLARRDFQLVQRTSAILGCAPNEVAQFTTKALEDRDTNFKSGRQWLMRAAQLEADAAVGSAQANGVGLKVIARVLEGLPPEYAGTFAAAVAKHENVIALIARAECGHLFFSQHPAADKDMNALMKEVSAQFGGKGGGSREAARGQIADSSRAREAIELASSKLEA